jgi:integrase
MPRKRKPENQGLPRRWRFYHGAYFYVVPPGCEAQWDGKKQFRLGSNKAEAYKVWADRLGALEKATTVKQLLERYALEVVPKKAPRTQVANGYDIPTLVRRFGHFRIEAVEPHHIYEYVSNRKKADGTPALTAAHREVELLSHAFTWAVQWGLLKKHPFKKEVRFERDLQPKGGERYVEDWEIIECLSLKPFRKKGSVLMCQAYIILKLCLGARMTDLLRLEPARDFTPEGILIQPSKTAHSSGVRQLIPWSPELIRARDMALAARPLDIAPYLFCTADGGCYVDENAQASGFQSIWQRFMDRVLKETEVKVRFAERDIRAKVGSDVSDLERARQILGHVDARTTAKHYRRRAEIVPAVPLADAIAVAAKLK